MPESTSLALVTVASQRRRDRAHRPKYRQAIPSDIDAPTYPVLWRTSQQWKPEALDGSEVPQREEVLARGKGPPITASQGALGSKRWTGQGANVNYFKEWKTTYDHERHAYCIVLDGRLDKGGKRVVRRDWNSRARLGRSALSELGSGSITAVDWSREGAGKATERSRTESKDEINEQTDCLIDYLHFWGDV
ncbi:hypothetical protein K474DRAFT_1697127 [Panus rudis PR-1116 ss-1]|nr:hypothetical protein K474DRAFT_1697127 [Panus rudis PR-1116 ss-1]